MMVPGSWVWVIRPHIIKKAAIVLHNGYRTVPLTKHPPKLVVVVFISHQKPMAPKGYTNLIKLTFPRYSPIFWRQRWRSNLENSQGDDDGAAQVADRRLP